MSPAALRLLNAFMFGTTQVSNDDFYSWPEDAQNFFRVWDSLMHFVRKGQVELFEWQERMKEEAEEEGAVAAESAGDDLGASSAGGDEDGSAGGDDLDDASSPSTVLEKKIPWPVKPLRKWKKKHVVPIRSRPVRNSHGCLVCGNKRTKCKEHTCHSNEAACKPVSHIWALRCDGCLACCFWHSNDWIVTTLSEPRRRQRRQPHSEDPSA